MTYFVTGATGLVGSHVLDRLRSRGASVRALVRRPPGEAWGGVDVVVGDLGDAGVLRSLLQGADIVLHCAGAVGMTLPRKELWAVNVEGTERLLEASLAAGVSRFVHLSSVAVYGAATAPVGEDAPKRPEGAYPESKWEAEKVVQRYQQRGLDTVVLRPCVIYGERDRHAVQALRRMGRLKVLPLPRGGSRRLDLVHALDVADAMLAAAEAPDVSGRAYNITDGGAHTQRDIVALYGRLSGREPLVLPLPGVLFDLLGLTARGLSAVRPTLARRLGRLRALDVDLHYSIEAARRDLAYEPRVDLADGMANTLRWFESQPAGA